VRLTDSGVIVSSDNELLRVLHSGISTDTDSLVLDSSGTAMLRGTVTKVGGATGCQPAARIGDSVFGSADQAGTVTGQISTGGNTLVC
jgi:hypothetical protein